jgi:hypothetical protein
MSARDYALYHKQLPQLHGRRSFVTLATNSIKVHIDEAKRNGTFLWLDPPWEFRRDDSLIETSDSCPHYTEPDYNFRFASWGSRFQPIFESTIRDIVAAPDGSLKITFESGYDIFLPQDDSVQTDCWYDHWYYREAAKA